MHSEENKSLILTFSENIKYFLFSSKIKNV